MKTLAGYKLAETLGLTFKEVEHCSKIARLAKRHRKRMENVCNYTWANTETYSKETELLRARIVDAVTSMFDGVKVKVVVRFEGDPRGYTVKVAADTGKPIDDLRYYGLD